MTTIAYRDGILAADSQGTSNGRAELGMEKIRVATDDSNWTVYGKRVAAYAVAGMSSAKEYVRRALTKGLDVDCPLTTKDYSLSALIVTEEGEVFIWVYTHSSKSNHTYHDVRCKTGPAAVGSGASYALAVMSVGGDAQAAVKAGITFDIYTGGEIKQFDLKNFLEERAERARELSIEE